MTRSTDSKKIKPRNLARPAWLRAAIVLALLPSPVLAQLLPAGGSEAPAQQCQPPGTIPERGELNRSADLPMDIRAQEIRAPGGSQQPMIFDGDVRLLYGDQLLKTDELIYSPETGEVHLPGWLEYSDALVRMEAASARYNTETSSGEFESVRYFIAGASGAGHAGSVRMLDETHAQVTRFDFTTCDIEDPDWQLKAGEVKLDFEKGVGTARHARLEFKGVPFLYSPWLSFPLNDQRKSGFLYPQIGSSSDNGMDLAIPYYWNIAPNQDATFTPRTIGDRGAMLGSEYRFLTRQQAGTFNFDYLPDDDEEDRDRWLGRIRHDARLAPNWSTRLNFNRVSDEDYFLDLGDELESTAIQSLRSEFQVRGQGRFWSLQTTVDTFQVLDRDVLEENEPYDRLPRIEFDGDWPLPGGLNFRLDSEAVYFERDLGVTGARLDALPELALRIVRPGWFIEPALGLRTTAYKLQDEPGDDDTPTRTQPILSLDGGLVFERRTASGRTHTLEPRAFYLYVPGRSQDDIPVFDTRELTFSFAQLFQTNRFSGADRQTDANQLALALTSRLLDDADGRSILDASIGQIFFFNDPSVGLPDEPSEDRSFSATVGEINWRASDRFLINAGLQWDPEDNETDVAAVGLRWQGNDARQVQLGYRFRRDRVDQIDVRGRYPLTREVNLIGRFDYSFEDSTALEVLGGIEYESCCWALRASIRRFISDRESDKRTAFFLELHLKGLGSLGRRPYNLFTN
ncbi:MAG: LPS assembly protein LptD [Wenzhouxiangellaceae bacterium]|nr:LPS assembly protein LptD [Wenzhouxiangellaceae bacterium]